MAPIARLRLGEGARCSCLVKFIRPSKDVAAALVNPEPGRRVEDLTAVSREATTRGGKTFVAIFFRSSTIPGLLHAAERWVKVEEEGPPDQLWEDAAPAEAPATAYIDERGEDIADFVFNAQNRAEDIALVRNMGFEVDDDNDPAPENVPDANAPPVNGGVLLEGQEWGWDGIDRRAMLQGAMYNGPSFTNDWSPKGKPFIEIFLHFFPCYFLEVTIVEATNSALLAVNAAQTTYGELLRYIGMMLLMSCYMKSPDYFWRASARAGDCSEDEENDVPSFTFNRYMSRRRYLAITAALRFTTKPPPSFRDKFWQIREMIASWNEHMQAVFVSAWALCLDESMSIWNNRWTCPGWVFCPRKPWPFGNEYHTACCGLSGIMFVMEMVEGKDHPPQVVPRYSELGKTTGLLMRMLQSYFSTGRYVILDSGFCVLKALVQLKKVGMFACAVIKKRRYWPAFVPGEAISREFDNLELKVGDTLAISRKLDGEEYFFWALKEPSYIMKMMAMGGPLLANDSCGEQKRRWTEGGVERAGTFRFPCPYDWHYKFRHAVDDHNNLRHALPSIEHTITTTRWEMRVFSFVLAVTEVNAFLAYRFFCRPDPVPTLQKFRHKLAWQLIKNKWLATEAEEESHVVTTVHQLMVAPLHATKFANRRWVCNAKQPHQNYPCSIKKCGTPPKRIKTYCSCCPTKWICKFCHAAHVVSEMKRE